MKQFPENRKEPCSRFILPMSSQTTCPRCEATYPLTIAGGMCPHCLLARILGNDTAPRLGEQAGDAVGPYELVEHLADGGMGSVWRARQLHPVEREVALKIIRLGMDTRELVSRFEAERQSLAMMDHPGIARVYEAGATASGRPYFAMELVEGEMVTDYCVSRSLPIEQRLRLFMEICAAVEHAHRKGVLHRDIKPSNVMVVETAGGPRIKVIDFGIAKLLETKHDGRTFATRVGHAVGTPGYMSPEQAGAEPDVDTRSDVYSLGALLYEMLTGTPPLGKETFHEVAYAEIMRVIRETDPPRPSTRTGPATAAGATPHLRIARDLDRIVMKALARERERRYGGAATLGEDVRRFLDHEPVTATDPTLAYRAGKFVRKHRLAVAFCAALVIALAVSSLLIAREATVARAAAAGERAARLDALSGLADSYRDAGLEKSWDRDDALAALWFTHAARTAPHDPERTTANRLRAALHTARAPIPVRYLERPMPGSPRLRFDASGTYLLEESASGPDVIFDLKSGLPVDFSAEVRAAALLPGGLAAVSDGDSVAIHELAGGRQHDLFDFPGGGVELLRASEDGELLFVGGAAPRVWNRSSKRFATGTLVHPLPVRHAAISADGHRVLTVDTRNDLRVFDIAEGTREGLFEPFHIDPLGADDPLAARFEEGSSKVRARTEWAMRVLDAATGKPLEEMPDLNLVSDLSPDGRSSTSFLGVKSPNGEYPGFSRSIGTSMFLPDQSGIYAERLGEILGMRGNRRMKLFLPGSPWRISPDGELLAVRHPTGIIIYQIARPEPFIRIFAPTPGIIALSDDGLLIASAGWNSPHLTPTTTRAYRIEDGLPAGPLIDTGYQHMCGAFLPDGRSFITGGRETPIPDSPFYIIDEQHRSRGVLKVWDMISGEKLAGPLFLPEEPQTLLRHPRDPWVAVLCADGSVHRVDYELAASRVLAAPRLGERPSADLIPRGNLLFSEDGRTLYANGLDTCLRAIDVATGEVKFTTAPARNYGLPMDLTNGTLLSPTRSANDKWLFDAASGEPLTLEHRFKHDDYLGTHFDPAGNLLVPGRRRIFLIDWRNGAEICRTRFDMVATSTFSGVVKGKPWLLSAIGSDLEPPSLRLWDARTGIELGPRWPLGEGYHAQHVFTPDGRHSIVSLKRRGYVIVKLDELRNAAETELSDADLLLLAEIDAGRRIIDGRPSQLLTVAEWAEMWKDFTTRHLGYRSLRPDLADLLRWHRNEEAYHGAGPGLSAWHRARINTLEEK